MDNVIIQKFNKAIETNLYHYYWKQLRLFDWEKRIEERKNEVARCKTMLETFELLTDVDLHNKQFLDIGCGWGGFLAAAALKGANVKGCDIHPEVLHIAKMRLSIQNSEGFFFTALAEQLPVADKSMDIIVCISVIEHVNNVGKVINEISRVLKDDGIAWLQLPNYWIPVEPHYKILFPPKCPKPLAKIWLLLFGKPVQFIDSINYTDHAWIISECKKNNFYIYDINNAPKIKYIPKELKTNIRYKSKLNFIYHRLLNYCTQLIEKYWKIMFKVDRINYIVSRSVIENTYMKPLLKAYRI